VVTRVTPSKETDAFVVDDVALPRQNPWRRLVRASDIQFLPDGTAAVVTLDGDVWLARGLAGPAGQVRWRRFASGLHEPLTLAVRDGQIYAFDRNGIWRLEDTNQDGEADVHELFSNAFAQTADMREFPNTIRLAPRGEFVIAKGGQEATTIGKHNGSVLRVSSDGREATVLGYGLRQPNLGVNLRTGLVTASDQQGHYIPSTPLHVIRDRQFYGFISTTLPPETYPSTPVANPLTWIPHAVNASAMSQVWLFDARLGPLNDSLVHIGFNRPELFRVLLNTRGRIPQAAVVSITHDFDFPPLNGSVNPADGLLYLAGFQILGWGTTASRLDGLGRLRYTGAASTLPREIAAMDKGVLLRFDVELDAAKAADPSSYTIASWHYRRSHQYGSPQLRADGTPGIDHLAASRAYLSSDRRSVFVAIPGMMPVMQMQIGWSLATATGIAFRERASFTPYELTPFDPRAEGFGALTIDLSPTTRMEQPGSPITAAEGRLVYERVGCMACHANDRSSTARLGPSLAGLYGSPREFAGGKAPIRADDAYLREAILEPAAKIVAGYEKNGVGMPSYAGVLSDAQVESVILYIRSLK
jgi:mono/diheme cytochrome c family protein